MSSIYDFEDKTTKEVCLKLLKNKLPRGTYQDSSGIFKGQSISVDPEYAKIFEDCMEKAKQTVKQYREKDNEAEGQEEPKPEVEEAAD